MPVLVEVLFTGDRVCFAVHECFRSGHGIYIYMLGNHQAIGFAFILYFRYAWHYNDSDSACCWIITLLYYFWCAVYALNRRLIKMKKVLDMLPMVCFKGSEERVRVRVRNIHSCFRGKSFAQYVWGIFIPVFTHVHLHCKNFIYLVCFENTHIKIMGGQILVYSWINLWGVIATHISLRENKENDE